MSAIGARRAYITKKFANDQEVLNVVASEGNDSSTSEPLLEDYILAEAALGYAVSVLTDNFVITVSVGDMNAATS